MLKIAINAISLWMIPVIILVVLIWGLVKKVPVYETFVDGAKDGLRVSVNILPYLVAIIVAVSMLRASGAIELVQNAFSGVFEALKIPADILPVMIVRSLSGSAVLGLLSDIVQNFGPDSYPAKLAAVIVGSSETTFYVLAVYFGAVKISKTGVALPCALLADFAGIVTAIFCAYLFYSHLFPHF